MVVRRGGALEFAGACIALENVSKTYARQAGDLVEALRSISFSVLDGEFLAIVGPSGCGKTTLLKMIAGLVPVSSGRIVLRGNEVTSPCPEVGIVFQSPVLLPWRTVLSNVMLPITIRRLRYREYLDRGRRLLQLVGLEGFEDAYPHELSGGMQQRVAIARALVHDPAILLMDEPFGALDAMTRQAMNLELARIWEASQKTVVLITHDISEAVFHADRVLVMSPRPGQILEVVTVGIPRPRGLDTTTDPAFTALVRRIQRLLGLGDLPTDR